MLKPLHYAKIRYLAIALVGIMLVVSHNTFSEDPETIEIIWWAGVLIALFGLIIYYLQGQTAESHWWYRLILETAVKEPLAQKTFINKVKTAYDNASDRKCLYDPTMVNLIIVSHIKQLEEDYFLEMVTREGETLISRTKKGEDYLKELQ